MPFVFVATVAESPHSYKAHSSSLKRSVYVAQNRKPPEWPERSFTYNIFPCERESCQFVEKYPNVACCVLKTDDLILNNFCKFSKK
jgi:hypothetical protein